MLRRCWFIVNVSVLTEGWDHPPTSCVVLLRPCACKSTFIQMIGRGLRILNQEEYPGVLKTDCLVLDFGNATLTHGSLEQLAQLEDSSQVKKSREESTKVCPRCQGSILAIEPKCPLCSLEFREPEVKPVEGVLEAEDFVMREIELLKYSPFQWAPLDQGQESLMASGFKAWSRVVFKNDQWHAVGGLHKEKTRLLTRGDKMSCLAAAHDWMTVRETADGAHKTRGWLTLPPTASQLRHLPDHWNDYDLNRYQAALLITLKFKNDEIETVLSQGGSL